MRRMPGLARTLINVIYPLPSWFVLASPVYPECGSSFGLWGLPLRPHHTSSCFITLAISLPASCFQDHSVDVEVSTWCSPHYLADLGLPLPLKKDVSVYALRHRGSWWFHNPHAWMSIGQRSFAIQGLTTWKFASIAAITGHDVACHQAWTKHALLPVLATLNTGPCTVDRHHWHTGPCPVDRHHWHCLHRVWCRL